jgi:hypothetical protein
MLRANDPGSEGARSFLYRWNMEIPLDVDIGEILSLVRIGEREPPAENDEPHTFSEVEPATVGTAPDGEYRRNAGFLRKGTDVEQFAGVKVVGPQLDHVNLVPEPFEGGEILGYRGAGKAQAYLRHGRS